MIESNDQEDKKTIEGRADLRVVSDRASKSYGAVLKNTRAKKELSLQDISAELKIPLSTLKSLEDQDYEKLPADAYAIGYIRSYGQLLGLNPEGLIKDFRQDKQYRHLGEQERQKKAFHEIEQKKRKDEPVVEQQVKEALAKTGEFWSGNKLPLIVLTLLLVVAFLLGLNISSRQEKDEPEIIDRVSVESVDGSVVVSDIMDQPQTTPLVHAGAGATSTGDRVKLVFSGTSWVTVRDANKELIHQSRKQRGEILELAGEAPFYLRLSKASAVNVSMNGKEIDTRAHVSDDDQLHDFPLLPSKPKAVQ